MIWCFFVKKITNIYSYGAIVNVACVYGRIAIEWNKKSICYLIFWQSPWLGVLDVLLPILFWVLQHFMFRRNPFDRKELVISTLIKLFDVKYCPCLSNDKGSLWIDGEWIYWKICIISQCLFTFSTRRSIADNNFSELHLFSLPPPPPNLSQIDIFPSSIFFLSFPFFSYLFALVLALLHAWMDK